MFIYFVFDFMKWVLFHRIPRFHKEFTSQVRRTSVSKEFVEYIRSEKEYLLIHRIFQFFCFILFFHIKFCFIIVTSLYFLAFSVFTPLLRAVCANRVVYLRSVHPFVKVFYRLVLLSVGVIHLNVEGQIDEDARFIISNHVSILDYLVFFCIHPITLVTRRELSSVESLFTKNIIETFYLKKKKLVSRSEQVLRLASDPMYMPILIFPEESPTNGEAVWSFSSSIFNTDYIIQPSALSYKVWMAPHGFNSIYSSSLTLDFVIRVLAAPFMTVTVKLLKSSRKKSLEMERNPRNMAKSCQLEIANTLGAIALSSRSMYPGE